MIQIKVWKNGENTHGGLKSTMEEAQAWVNQHVGMGSFGSPRWTTVNVEIFPAVYDSSGELISAAQFEDQQMENIGGFEVEMLDTSTQEAF
jgi:hypothetical protein